MKNHMILVAAVVPKLKVGDIPYNVAQITEALVPKAYLPNYSEFYECRWFASGRGISGQTVSIEEKEI